MAAATTAGTRSRAILESARRVALLGGWAAAAWLYFDAYHGPYVQVRLPLAEAPVSRAPRAPSALLENPRADDEAPAIVVDGPEWAAYLATVRRTLSEGPGDSPLESRVWRAGTRPILYQRTADPPLAQALAGRPTNRSWRLRHAGDASLRLDLYVADGASFHLGGFAPTPAAFFYPRRGGAAWPLAIGLLLYVLLPRRRPRRDELAMARWRVALGDFGALLLFGLFFALPLAIPQSARAAAGEWLGLTVVFWLLAALGLWLAWWITYYAVFRLRVAGDLLEIETLSRSGAFRASDVARLEPASLRYPRWLVWLVLLSAMAGRGSAAAGQLGRGLLLASAKSNGWRIEDRAGTAFHLWLTDPMGNVQFDNAGALEAWIAQVPVEPSKALREIRAAFPPDWA